MTALVGESGSGKSTLAKLMVHFYDVADGSIKIGGQDIRDMSIEALNNEISYVSQEQARAILKDAPIIVLDEATAFMDPENEEKMNEAIAEVIKNKTVIVIAHRLYTIVNADQICVLDNGRLASSGTHEKLLSDCAQYQKLWKASEGSQAWKISSGDAGLEPTEKGHFVSGKVVEA